MQRKIKYNIQSTEVEVAWFRDHQPGPYTPRKSRSHKRFRSHQHVAEVVRARAEAAGLRVLRTAGARVQKGAGVQAVCHASHAGELFQEVRSQAHGLRGQVARRFPKKATEGTVQQTEHWGGGTARLHHFQISQ